jgi:hypothetical protein
MVKHNSKSQCRQYVRTDGVFILCYVVGSWVMCICIMWLDTSLKANITKLIFQILQF